MNAKAISAQSTKKSMNRGCLFAFGLVFLIAGVGSFYAVMIAPLFTTIKAQSWNQAQATILSSDVITSRGNKSTTYRADIKFQYEYQNVVYKSETWNTDWATSSGSKSGAEATVKRYPAGSNHPCYVNPNDPAQAVLDRSYQVSNLFGLFTLLFIIIGGAVMYGAVKTKAPTESNDSDSTAQPTSKIVRSSTRGSANNSSEAGQFQGDDDDDQDDEDDFEDYAEDAPWTSLEGPQKLKPTESRFTTFIVMLIVAIFWNGLSWFGFINTIMNGEWFATLFLLLFVGVGAVLFFTAIYKLLQCFNPVVEVALSNGAVVPGETVDIAWETTGRVERIRNLRLSIIGEEVVTYVRGTTTSTDRKVFQRIEIAEVSDAESKRFGSASVTIPSGTIHSFWALNNKIQWSIEVHGDIGFWPDIHETMLFAIKPSATEDAPS